MRSTRLFPVMVLILLVTMMLASCMTYTYADAKLVIAPESSVPEAPLKETKLSAIQQATMPQEPMAMKVVGLKADTEPEPIEPAVTTEPEALLTLRAALVPLPCNAEEALLSIILQEAERTELDVIGFVGDARSIDHIAQHATLPTIRLGDDRLLLTDLAVLETTAQGATLAVEQYRTVSISVVNLQDSNVFAALRASSEPAQWERTIAEAHELRLASLGDFAYRDLGPHLILAALGEPSAEDWHETATGHAYRLPFDWPMTAVWEEAGYLDSWRMTHHSAQTDSGVTWEFSDADGQFSERVDYLLAKELLPIETSTIPIGPWEQERLPYEQRSAVTGTFLIP